MHELPLSAFLIPVMFYTLKGCVCVLPWLMVMEALLPISDDKAFFFSFSP